MKNKKSCVFSEKKIVVSRIWKTSSMRGENCQWHKSQFIQYRCRRKNRNQIIEKQRQKKWNRTLESHFNGKFNQYRLHLHLSTLISNQPLWLKYVLEEDEKCKRTPHHIQEKIYKNWIWENWILHVAQNFSFIFVIRSNKATPQEKNWYRFAKKMNEK